jgi:RNA polymerase sigma-70 factor (ECF subfamily)
MRRLSGDGAMAEDLAQQVFVQAWRSLRTMSSPAAFAGWLRQVAVNVWLQEARRGRLMTTPIEAVEESALGHSELREQLDLARALALLPAPERLCVVLNYAEGLSHGEIVAATGLPLGTVKSHVSRGAARLRRLLGERDDG